MTLTSTLRQVSLCANVAREGSGVLRSVLWFLLTATLTAFLGFQLKLCLEKIMDRSIYMKLTVSEEQYMPVPRLTIMTEYVKKDILEDNFNLSREWNPSRPWGSHNLEDILKSTSLGYSEVIKYVYSRGVVAPSSRLPFLCRVPRVKKQLTVFGVTYTLSWSKKCRLLPGIKNYIFLTFVDGDAFHDGIRVTVAVHSPFDPFSAYYIAGTQEETVESKKGVLTQAKLTAVKRHRKNTEKKPCVQPSRNYSRVECIEECAFKQQLLKIGCRYSTMKVVEAPLCNSSNAANLRRLYGIHDHEEFEVSECVAKNCPEYCYDEKFQVYKSRESVEGTTGLKLYYPHRIIEEYSEEWSYDFSTFLADFGGSLGLFLGISIIGVVEILEAMMQLGVNFAFGTKEIKKEEEKEMERKSSSIFEPI